MNKVELLALLRVPGVSWHFVAREAQRPGGPSNLQALRSKEGGTEAVASLQVLAQAASDDLERHREWVLSLLAAAESEGIRLTTILDDDYPVNLRSIFNLPPFLFYRGELRVDDAYSVAVVGTREATDRGLAAAADLSRELSHAGVTVLSGLARGIDSAAHEACLEAGGRTVAVLGSGIRNVYPPENRQLAHRIEQSGAVVSQFWPDSPPTSYTFPRRNVVTSGLGQGTVVVEASSTSGAKMQARLALEHGKMLFLPTELVEERTWAKDYLRRGGIQVSGTREILARLKDSRTIEQRAQNLRQLSFSLE